MSVTLSPDRARLMRGLGAGSVIGIDLGGTNVVLASLSETTPIAPVTEPTHTGSERELLEQIIRMVRTARTGNLRALGLGVPSIVEFSTGRVVSSVNVPLVDVPLREVLGDALGIPVFVDNDATLAAYAEAHDEQLQLRTENLVMLTLGTGVGGGIVIGGAIYRGATGGAGEFGHTLVGLDAPGTDPPPARFPQAGSLEAVASGRALDRTAARAAKCHPRSELGRSRSAGRPVLAADAIAAARNGDETALRAVESWARWVGIGIANAINTFDPGEVVLGGGPARAAELLLGPAAETAWRYVLPGLGDSTTIRLARHGVRAGVLGAALLAADALTR
jgi:glucokinase